MVLTFIEEYIVFLMFISMLIHTVEIATSQHKKMILFIKSEPFAFVIWYGKYLTLKYFYKLHICLRQGSCWPLASIIVLSNPDKNINFGTKKH